MKQRWLKQVVVAALIVSPCLTLFAQEADSDALQDQLRVLRENINRSRGQDTTIRPQIAPQIPPQTADPNDTGIGAAFNRPEISDLVPQTPPPQTAVKPKPKKRELSLSDEAYSKMTSTTLPMSPEQIKTLRKMFSRVQRAAAQHPGTPPKPTSSSIIVNLAPGSTPPVIRLSAGFVTSLVFVDATGAPWPIFAYDLGDPRAFNIQSQTIQSAGGEKSNTLLVQAISEYKTGNLAVLLKGMNTPIMLTLQPGQRSVDYRVDLRLPGLGPNAYTQTSSLPSTSSPVLLNVLNGVAPAGAKKLDLSGGDGEAWMYHGELYLRTRMTVLSPSWRSSMSSADGMHVYLLQKTPVILASHNGKMHKLMLKGF